MPENPEFRAAAWPDQLARKGFVAAFAASSFAAAWPDRESVAGDMGFEKLVEAGHFVVATAEFELAAQPAVAAFVAETVVVAVEAGFVAFAATGSVVVETVGNWFVAVVALRMRVGSSNRLAPAGQALKKRQAEGLDWPGMLVH